MNSVKANDGRLRAVLKGLNLSEYADLLEREDVDLEILADVKEEQLERIGVKTLGQRLKIIGAAKKAETMNKKQSAENLEFRGKTSQEKGERDDATENVGEGKTDEGKRKESKEKTENKIEDKSEEFLTIPKTSSDIEGFLAKSKKTPKDDSLSNSLKGTKERSQKETEDKSQKGTKDNIDEKIETSLKNQTWGPDPEWKSPFKSSSDSSEDSSSEGMSTTGGMLYTAAVLALKMMEPK